MESCGVMTSALLRVTTHAVCAASRICTLYVALARAVQLPLVCQLVPPSMLYSNVPYPPAGLVMVIVPSFAPLQVTLVEATSAVKAAGCVMTHENSWELQGA